MGGKSKMTMSRLSYKSSKIKATNHNQFGGKHNPPPKINLLYYYIAVKCKW